MGTVTKLRPGFRIGQVDHINWSAGFGYVRTIDPDQRLIFIFGQAIRHADAGRLSVGSHVMVRVSGRGRINELQPLKAAT